MSHVSSTEGTNHDLMLIWRARAWYFDYRSARQWDASSCFVLTLWTRRRGTTMIPWLLKKAVSCKLSSSFLSAQPSWTPERKNGGENIGTLVANQNKMERTQSDDEWWARLAVVLVIFVVVRCVGLDAREWNTSVSVCSTWVLEPIYTSTMTGSCLVHSHFSRHQNVSCMTPPL